MERYYIAVKFLVDTDIPERIDGKYNPRWREAVLAQLKDRIENLPAALIVGSFDRASLEDDDEFLSSDPS